MNECTSEKQAKKILDYLAKKIGYDEITIPNGTKYNYVVLSSSPCVNKRRSYSLLYSCSYRLNLGKIITTKFDTYVELLEYVFHLSSSGFEIQDNKLRVFFAKKCIN